MAPRLLPLALLTALVAAPLSFVAPRSARGVLRGVRLQRSARGGADETPGNLLDELLEVADSGNQEELAAKVDAAFPRLLPEDLTVLQTRFQTAPDDSKPAMEELTKCIQVAMESRMEKAKGEIDELLMSSGDIDANIKASLERQDSPLPMISVLQINIQQAQQNGNEKQQQALTYILTIVARELQAQVPLTTRLLSRLLSTESADERRQLLRAHLDAMQGTKTGPEGSVEEIASAVVALVEDAERQFESNSVPVETRKQTLELIRNVALDCGVVVGEIFGDESQGEFTEKLQPLFDALSKV